LRRQYLVYQCGELGIVCNLIAIPFVDIDRRMLPGGTLRDVSAEFAISYNNTLQIVCLSG